MISMKTGIPALVAGALLSVALPSISAEAASVPGEQKQRLGSVEKRDVWERDRVRRQQIRQNAGTPMYEPFFHPFYRGKNAPIPTIKRAID